MLVADSISFQGRHHELVPPTSLSVAPGELLLMVGETQEARTAAALLLSGRMKPTGGTVNWGSNPRLVYLRKHSALINAPKINEPEAHLKIRDVVSEDLSLIPAPPWRTPNPKKWMRQHGYADIAGHWVDAVDPQRLTEMLTLLAVENPQTRVLVADSPDRHGGEDELWLESLERFAHSSGNFAVIATVARVPECWDGPVAYLGFAEQPAPINPLPDIAVAGLAEQTQRDPDELDEPAELVEQEEQAEQAEQPAPATELSVPDSEVQDPTEPADATEPTGKTPFADVGPDPDSPEPHTIITAEIPDAEDPAHLPARPAPPTSDPSQPKD
ncbi:ABC transporter ATP-binding protein [Glutamicibacter sp. NPDC087344]|uniref:ABC transporter ATP-binding protein n=1 Tax=Glutamicibacter sp. NPDC087344 TaxID=3363994 RepID=UPI00381BF66C